MKSEKLSKTLSGKKEILRSKYLYIFLLILAVGIFLRGYQFTPWLHFELDQARDAALVSEAYSDIGKLPLLGPRAAGTFARLGPSFYYIEYSFAKVFGNTPQGSAYAILFFSILSIPAFYLLFRRYFSKIGTLSLLVVYAVSLYVVTYSRFGWNPNLLPFFILMFLYSLLRSVDEDEEKRGWWLVGSAMFFALLSHFHFLALIIISITAVIFLIYKRPKIKLWFWLGAVSIFLLFYVPVFINEAKTGGDNYQQLLLAITKKADLDESGKEDSGESSNKNEHNFPEKIIRNYSENVNYYWIILTGSQTAQIPKVQLAGGSDIKCDRECRDHLLEGIVAFLLFTAGLFLLIFKVVRIEKSSKKDFLVLNVILFTISFLIFIPLAFDFSARFFLIIIPLPFLFLGLIIEQLGNYVKKKDFIWILVIIFILSNLYFINKFFDQLRDAATVEYKLSGDKILKQKTRITLEQEIAIADYMENFYRENGYPVIYKGQPEFHRAFSYLMDQREIPRDGIEIKKVCKQGNYFLIYRTQSDGESIQQKYKENFEIVSEEKFGTLVVYRMIPKKEKINCEKFDQNKFRTYKNEGGAVAKRYTWGEIFGE